MLTERKIFNMIKKIELPYKLDALEPYYSKETLDIHYNTLYDRYVQNTNLTLEKLEQATTNKKFKFLWVRSYFT